MNKFEQELNENPAKAFFVRHGEKLGLLLGIVLLVVFVYLGVTLSPELEDKTPSSVFNSAGQAENRIQSASWDELSPYRQAIEGTVAKLDETKVPVDASDYPIEYMLARRVEAKPLRTDPKILAPIDPIADVARVSVVDVTSQRSRHPLELLKPIELGPATAAASGPAAGGESNDKKEEVDVSALAEVPGLDPSKAQLSSVSGTVPTTAYMVTVRMALPYKEMYEEFKSTFRNAVGYNAQNDRFLIRYMQIQRRVNGGGDDAWEDITEQLKKQQSTYVTSAPNPFEDKYINTILTQPFPPVLLRDYYRMALHPLIPMEDLPEEEAGSSAFAANSGRRSGPSGASGGRSSYNSSSSSSRSGSRSGQSSYRSQMQGRSGASSQNRGRSSYGMTSGGGGAASTETSKELADYKLVRFVDQSVQPGNSYEYRARIWVYDPNNPIEMDGFVKKEEKRQGPTAATSAASDDERLTRGKLDGEDEEDLVIQSQVKPDQLSPETQERLQAEAGLERPLPKLMNCRPSAWSDPTPAVAVRPILGDAYVAEAEAPREGRVVISNREIRFPTKEGFLENAVAAVWDDRFGIQVPLTIKEAFVGAVLGGQEETKILDPIQRTYKRMPNNIGIPPERGRPDGYKGNSGVVLVDFMGGQDLDSVTSSRSDFKIPTEALVLDSAGNLQVRNARSDARNYTWLTGQVLREDGVAPKEEFDEEENDSSSASRRGRSNRGRSGYSGGQSGRPGGAGGSGSSQGSRNGSRGYGGGNRPGSGG